MNRFTEELKKYVIEALKKYAVFSGRSRRKEYWYFALFLVALGLLLSLIDGLIGTFNSPAGIESLSDVFKILLVIPGIAVSVRRLHDIDRSGWWFLISLVPLIGVIALIVLLVQDGTPGSNRYGPNPKTAIV